MSSALPEPLVSYVLQLIKAGLTGSFKKKPDIYCSIRLTEKITVKSHVLKHASAPVWNQSFPFESLSSQMISIQVKHGSLLKFYRCLGQTQISIEELLRKCEHGGQAEMELNNTKGKIGSIIVVLRKEIHEPATIGGAREALSSTQQAVYQSRIDHSRKIPDLKVGEAGTIVMDMVKKAEGLDALASISSKLEKLKPFVDMMDAVSTIHPYFEVTWGVVSSLYKIYQKKSAMELEIVELVNQMNDVLSFVEDTDLLKDKLHNFIRVIEDALQVIGDCCASISKYLNASLPGQTWKAFSEAEKLHDFKTEFAELVIKLNRAVGMHTARHAQTISDGVHKVQEQQGQALQTLGNIQSTVSELQQKFTAPPAQRVPTRAPSTDISPPPPTKLFTGRENILERLATHFKLSSTSVALKKQRRYVLYGLGGMGKTQIVLRFLQSNSDKFSAQYMIDASSAESITNAFEAIGYKAGIAEPNKIKVMQWLCEQKDDWVLFFDNADDPNVALASFFPNCTHGNIIITTRNADIGALMPEDSLEVSRLEEDAAVSLLLRVAGLRETDENKTLAPRLTQEIGHLPLAVVQAGSYMATRHVDLKGYLDMYQRDRSALLKNASSPSVESPYRYKSAFSTWEISFSALSHPHAQQFINLCSFLHRDGIPEELFQRAATSAEVSDFAMKNRLLGGVSTTPITPVLDLLLSLRDENGQWSKMRFAELTHSLRSYSLISNSSQGIYSIHPLVHAWAQERMKPDEQQVFRENAQRLIFYSIPPNPPPPSESNANFFKSLIPHLNACANGQPIDVELGDRFSKFHQYLQQWQMAASVRERVLEIHRQNLGANHPVTLTDMETLAELYRFQSRFEDAAQLQIAVVNSKTQPWNSIRDAQTLISMHKLALIYLAQGRLSEVQQLEEQVLRANLMIMGYTEIISSTNNLALAYMGQNRTAEAMVLLEPIAASKHFQQNYDSNLLSCVLLLAKIYLSQSRVDSAVAILVELLGDYQRTLGNDHPETLDARACLASAYQMQGRPHESLNLRIELVNGNRRAYGNEHLITLASMCDLASSYRSLLRPYDALSLLEQVVEPQKRVLGANHPTTLQTMQFLSGMYLSVGRRQDAQNLDSQINAITNPMPYLPSVPPLVLHH